MSTQKKGYPVSKHGKHIEYHDFLFTFWLFVFILSINIHGKERVIVLTKIQKWGNSQGLRFPKAVLEDAQIKVGDEVNVSVRHGKIIVETVNKVRGAYNLNELVARIPGDYRGEEIEWGPAVGREEW